MPHAALHAKPKGSIWLLYKWADTAFLALQSSAPANTRLWPNAGLMLGHRLRRWPNIEPALVKVWCLLGGPRRHSHGPVIDTCDFPCSVSPPVNTGTSGDLPRPLYTVIRPAQGVTWCSKGGTGQVYSLITCGALVDRCHCRAKSKGGFCLLVK